MSTDQPSAYDSLRPKQKRFVDYYLQSGNATDAARKAGYKGNANTLRSIGGENLLKPALASAIKERSKPTEEKRIAETDEILQTLSDFMRDKDAPFPSRVRAAELLGKRKRLWSDDEEERSARIAYLKAKTAELIGGDGDDDGEDLEISLEEAKE